MDAKAEIHRLERLGEDAFAAMHEAVSKTRAVTHYEAAGAAFLEAIEVADRAGLGDVADRLRQRLTEIRSIFRTQFERGSV